MRATARRAVALALGGISRVAPRRSHVVVHGYPALEGNAVEIARACAQMYSGRTYWLIDQQDDEAQLRSVLGTDLSARVSFVAHRSVRALWVYATADAVFFTHGLFGTPPLNDRHTVVNVWHGGGFKANLMADEHGRPTVRSHFLLASSRRQGMLRAAESGVDARNVIFTSNPRVDQFEHDRRPESLRELGIDPARPFVVWMPTFRRSTGSGLTRSWSDSDASNSEDLKQVMERVVRTLARMGIQVVAKPHPMDADSRSVEGALTALNSDLAGAGVQLYELLGWSAGLITDFSSVWIDYLNLDQPIAFVMPDEEAYLAGRGIAPPDAFEVLPGPRLYTEPDAEAFAREVLQPSEASAAMRRAAAHRLGVSPGPRVAARFLLELQRRGAFKAGYIRDGT